MKALTEATSITTGQDTALCSELCRWCNDLCGGRGIDSGDVGRKALQCGNHSVCSRFHFDDGIGCGVGLIQSCSKKEDTECHI